MTAERWTRITHVFLAALELQAEKRAGYLDEVCGTDAALREEVERLLAQPDDSWLKNPLEGAPVPELETGQSLGRYRVEARVGEGGMGAVYKAQDTVLHRPVALKVLPGWRLADAESRRRLMWEARAASALDHPNIVTIHDIGQTDGVDFIAMEYVPGKQLGEVIPRKGLRVDEALKYAVQIADAVAAAHGAGIVHRDIKPSNIVISNSGQVKVLDFGLAKVTRPAWAGSDTSALRLPGASAEGFVLGTAAYMSPEQAQGLNVDARTDIFSFGAVLYEMVSGRRAFSGKNALDTLAAILTREPEPLGAWVPRDLQRLIGRCLHKDPARRCQHMDDVKVALEELREESGSRRVKARIHGIAGRWKRLLAIGGGALVLAAAAFVGWRFLQERERFEQSQFRLIQLTRDSGLTVSPALSADGRLVVYASDRADRENLDLWLQQVGGGGGGVRLTTHPASDHSPVFSPDGTRVAFCSERDGGGIYVMPTLGGDVDARLVAKGGQNPRFSPDGRMIAYHTGIRGSFEGSRMYVVPVDGGVPRQLQPDFSAAGVPLWTPDGNQLMFIGIHLKLGGDVWVAPLDGGGPARIGLFEALRSQRIRVSSLDAVTPRGDSLIFSGVLGDSANLWRVPISPKTWQARGAPERLTSGTAEQNASAAAGGRIVFFSGTRSLRLWGMNRAAGSAAALKPLTAGGAHDSLSDVSASGQLIAFRSNRSGNADIWVKDLRSGRETALTSNAAFESMPKLNRDGTRVAYSIIEKEVRVLYVQPANGGLPQEVCGDCGPPASWSGDGRKIAFVRIVRPSSEIHVLDLATGQTRPLLRHPTLALYGGQFSPDDKWIAFKADLDTRRTVVFAAPVHGVAPAPVEEWVKVTEGEAWDDLPRWSPGGNMLYFVSDRDGFRCIWARRVDPRTKQPQGETIAVRHFHEMQLSMSTLSLAEFSLAVAPNQLVFPLSELKGNIWLMEPQIQRSR